MSDQKTDEEKDIQRHDRRLKREHFTYEFMKSAEVYLDTLKCIVEQIYKPLLEHYKRCGIDSKKGPDEIDYVFELPRNMYHFHVGLFPMMQQQISILDHIKKYKYFSSMYEDYADRFLEVVNLIAKWSKHKSFLQFILVKLQGTALKDGFEDIRLGNFAWIMHRPLLRISEYYLFFKDMTKHTIDEKNHDNEDIEYDLLINSLMPHFKPLHTKLKKKHSLYQRKTRLLEIQFQVFGNHDFGFSIVPVHYRQKHNMRHFVYNRICQIRKGFLGKTKKQIQLYLLSDTLFWVSKRGQFKEFYRLDDPNFVFQVNQDRKNELVIGLVGGFQVKKTPALLEDAKSIENSDTKETSANSGLTITPMTKNNSTTASLDVSPFDKSPKSLEKGLYYMIFANDETCQIVYTYIKKTVDKFMKHKKLKHEASHTEDVSVTLNGSFDDDFRKTRHDLVALPGHDDHHLKTIDNNYDFSSELDDATMEKSESH